MVSEIKPARLSRHGPIDLPPVDDLVELAVNTWEICGRQRSGTVVCWNRREDFTDRPGPKVYGAAKPIFGSSPKTRLTSSAFAMHAQHANGSIATQGDLFSGPTAPADIDAFLVE